MEPAIFSSRRSSTNHGRCAVKGCNSKKNINSDLSFHVLPKQNKQSVAIKNHFGNLEQVDRLTAWKKVLNLKNAQPHVQVCSLHFAKEDYILPGNIILRA